MKATSYILPPNTVSLTHAKDQKYMASHVSQLAFPPFLALPCSPLPECFWLVPVRPEGPSALSKGHTPKKFQALGHHKICAFIFPLKGCKVQRQSHTHEGHQCDLLGLLCANGMGGYGYFCQKWNTGHNTPYKVHSFFNRIM